MSRPVTAAELARDAGIDPKRFRRELRLAVDRGEIAWHRKWDRWAVPCDSPEHHDMERVLTNLINHDAARERLPKARGVSAC